VQTIIGDYLNAQTTETNVKKMEELRALGKSLECCICLRLMETPARTKWYFAFTYAFVILFNPEALRSFVLNRFDALLLLTNLKTNHSAHYFCHECINNSIKRNGKCPLCKKDVQRRDINRDEQMEMLVKNYAEFVHLDGKRRRRNTILYQSQLALTQQQQRKKKKMKKKM
jgi:hypothetical protein